MSPVHRRCRLGFFLSRSQRNTSWTYDKNLVATREVIDRRLDEFSANVERQRAAVLASLFKYVADMAIN
ncbi:hypothetical protein Y032_0035g3062 [Ancylostoma ceylanicum]|uniref:Uncharacterized protein n=1 Tax=Ancylostoma ceylanicum TaxID=53326 RepID=A0A016UM14_9BILA|nr:hypothetical protein Y032_0035g3062 [Ancylostoma ceylanicum]